MSSSPASVAISSLEIVKPHSRHQRANNDSTLAILTLRITNFGMPRDGFVIVYLVRALDTAASADDEPSSDTAPPTFVDAVTYPGTVSIAYVGVFYNQHAYCSIRVRHDGVCNHRNSRETYTQSTSVTSQPSFVAQVTDVTFMALPHPRLTLRAALVIDTFSKVRTSTTPA